MLGKLFSLTSGSAAASPSSQNSQASTNESPESVQEDIHTRNLLFPDTQTLYSRQDQVFPLSTSTALTPGSPSNFDYDGEVDLDVRDVRVIVMQDSLGTTNPCLLYDSHPAPPVPPTEPRQSPGASHTQSFVKDLRRNPASSRKTSLSYSRPMVIQPDSPQPRQGAFDRRPSVQARTFTSAENEAQRAAREYREELSSFTSCIFANTEVMSYKGTSTKVHIVPSDSRPDVSSSFAGDGKGSIGRSSLRSSRLSQSFTAESASAAFSAVVGSSRSKDRKKILVTRLFPVNLPNDDPETPGTGVTPHSRLSEDGSGFPFPCSPDECGAKKKKSQPKQKRTPIPTQQPPSATKNAFKGPNSYNEQDSFPSSFNSARRSGWTMVSTGYGSDSIDSAYSNEVEDKMDAITQHWDIIMRTLTHLQSVVATTLFPMLKQADHMAPDPHQPSIAAQVARSSSINSRRGSNASQIQMKPPKTNAKLISLPPNCLMNEQQIAREIDAARVRIVTGLRATRVVTGQGRWGPWREEARWVAKYAGGKEQGFFFYKLLTGFLATHIDWLQALSPVWYRRRHYQQQKAKNDEDTSLPSRTIIISNDKMAARRLIFLLSAFLPTNQQLPTIRPQVRNTSASFSHSPPSFIIPILKEESLRRKINRRPAAPRGASHQRSFSIQSQATTRSAIGIPAQLDHLSMDALHGRRPSDATLFKPTALSSHGSDATTRKSSAATTNTIVPDAAVPHFASIHRTNTRRSHRPGSSGSMAADDLKRTLRRGDSVGQTSNVSTESQRRSSNWGSVISGLWSARRRESSTSTTHTLDFPLSHDGPLASPVRPLGRKDKLSEMVSEECAVETPTKDEFDGPLDNVEGQVTHPDTPRTLERRGQMAQDIVKRTPDPLGAFESPVKTSISADDGIIDVDVPFPDYLTSFTESAISSPSSSGYLSTPGLGAGGVDSFEHFSRVAVDGEAPLNVAGWLQQFHPDFALQAVQPQPDLLEKIKESLKAEPTPSYHVHQLPIEWPTEQWVDVSSAIVADTTTFTIKRIRFRRLVKPKMPANRGGIQNHSSSTNPYSSSIMTPALSPYEQPLEESMEEETLYTWDEALIDAVEKVTAHMVLGSQDSSTTNSSRSVSKRRERSDSDASESELPKLTASHADIPEVPRAECKTVVLSALENIVQEVVDQREKENHTPGNKAERTQAALCTVQGSGVEQHNLQVVRL
ncbi:folliculin-interacting protein N-terminus-domain-containing protein [Truncatella angustata]|uniref:Folliculin-interacting protein N-terminus-domain-containing protein n=1 Tax=Truncatella angustata TaxID=152316 RepID=A0A9P8UVD2_9PEZI|nr:folliculin-interacting protein N-terminus-domain-containing protein [Truncatella angustata]KAH6659201.1 folliculin-interacting protein N-terminus-domain-containing protein [Truncatella angustata]